MSNLAHKCRRETLLELFGKEVQRESLSLSAAMFVRVTGKSTIVIIAKSSRFCTMQCIPLAQKVN